MPVSTSLVSSITRIPFPRLNSFPGLFRAYTADFDSVASYYAADYRSENARREAARRAADYPRNRNTLVEVLLDQNERWGMDDAVRNHIEALRDPASVAVVTGQQIGLLLGPMYTILKTITMLQLTARLARETGRPVVPVFWLEGEDHDFDEVAGINLLHKNEIRTIRYDGDNLPSGANREPVGRLALTEKIEQIIAQIDEILPPTDFKPSIMQFIREAYQPGVTLLDAFARLMRALFPGAGLIMMNPSYPRLKQLDQPLFRRELEDYETSHALLQEVSSDLEQHFHAQVHTRPTNLFLLEQDGRYALDARDGRFYLRGKSTSLTRENVLSLVEQHPERFSPNVVLRPLVQDNILPTAVYVGGPAEISYFAQFKPVYEWAGIPMPVIYPRASVTFVERKIQKVLDRYEISLPDLQSDPERLFRTLVLRDLEFDLDTEFDAALRQVHEAINTIKPVIERVDRTLVKTAEATRATISKELDRLKERVVKAEKRRNDEIQGQLEKARVNLYPRNKLQERIISPFYFLNKYSPDLIKVLRERLSLDTGEHQVLVL